MRTVERNYGLLEIYYTLLIVFWYRKSNNTLYGPSPRLSEPYIWAVCEESVLKIQNSADGNYKLSYFVDNNDSNLQEGDTAMFLREQRV